MSWFSNFFNRNVLYTKDYNGDDGYFVESNTNANAYTNLQLAQNHPILSGALLFISNIFAQGRMEVRNKATGELILNNPYSKLLNSPNYYQTRIDFLESLQFLEIAQGRAIVWMKKPVGFTEPTEMYILIDSLITWPDDFKTPLVFRSQLDSFKNQKILYDQGNLNIEIKIDDLMFLYDMPNVGSTGGGLSSSNYNIFENASRLDGIRQTLINTVDSLVAKNTILKSNGKEMLSSNGNESPFTPDQQKKARSMFNSRYGPGAGRSRAFITSANITWQSLHIALRDLGLDESVKTDGNIIYTCLHIPKDVLSLEAKKTTYANFKESITSFIQNDITSMGNDLAESFMKEIGDDSIQINIDYNHLSVMRFLDKQNFEAKSAQAKALDDLRRSGIPDKMSLEMVNLPINTPLQPIREQVTTTTPQNGQASDKEKFLIAEALAESN